MFSCCNHVVAIRFNTVHYCLKVRKIGYALICSTIHHNWRLDKGKPTLLNEIYGKSLQGHFHSSKISLKEKESTSRNLCSPFKVNPFVLFNQFIVSTWFKRIRWFDTMQGMFCISRFICTRWHFWMKEIGNPHANRISLFKNGCGLCFHFRNP